MAKFCSECGFQLEDDSRFCVSCGAPCEPDQAPQPAAEPAAAAGEPARDIFSFSAERRYANSQEPGETEPAGGASDSFAPQPPAPSYPAIQQTPSYVDNSLPTIELDKTGFDVPAAPPAAPAAKSRRGLVIVLAVAAVLLIVDLIILFVFFNPFGGEKADDASSDATAPASAGAEAVTQPPTAVPAAVQPTAAVPTQYPAQTSSQPTAPASTQAAVTPLPGGADSVRAAIDTAFDHYYFRTRNVDRYLTVIYEYNFASDDSYRQSIRADYVSKFSDMTELNELAQRYGDDMSINFSVTNTKVLSGDEKKQAIASLGGNCDVSRIDQAVQVTFNTEVSGSKSTEKGLWYGYFFRVDGKWYTNLSFI